MVRIRTKDNRFGANGLLFKRDVESGGWEASSTDDRISDEELAILRQYSGKPVAEYPPGVIQLTAREVNASNQVSSQKQWLYQIHGGWNDDNTFRLDTGNMMGVVRLHSPDFKSEVQLEISSRFDEANSQKFLRHLLCVGLGVDITEEVGGDQESGWEFLLAYLFMNRLGEVMSVGLLKQYRSYHLNDFNPRGHIDISRHIHQNWPVLRGVAYTKTESVFDIPIIHLLRHAAEKIVRKWPDLLVRLGDASEMVKMLRENTPSWSANQNAMILQNRECLIPVHHPYFSAYYEPLRCLARFVLQDENASVYGSDDMVSGVLFNGADLWEEYLNVLLSRLAKRKDAFFALGEFNHANNRTRSDPIYLYRPRFRGAGRQRIYPDFRWRNSDVIHERHEWDCILDAKYKGLLKDNQCAEKGDCGAPCVSLEDRCEMAQYVMATKARLCVLMCPMKESECDEVARTSNANKEEDFRKHDGDCEWYEDGVFFGYEAKVVVIPMTIPRSDTTDANEISYENRILGSEERFLQTIESAMKSSLCRNDDDGADTK